MIIIGLTGSIGMGKSTAAQLLRKQGVPVHEADAAVHKLFARGGGAVAAVGALFPKAIVKGAVDRKKLGQIVYGNRRLLKKLEAVVHPLVHQATARWLDEQRKAKFKLVVLDIPLLFEADREETVDAIWVVSAPPDVQKARVLARPGMDAARFKKILSHQVKDSLKRKRADEVIPTGDGLKLTDLHLKLALKRAKTVPAHAWRDYWKSLTT